MRAVMLKYLANTVGQGDFAACDVGVCSGRSSVPAKFSSARLGVDDPAEFGTRSRSAFHRTDGTPARNG